MLRRSDSKRTTRSTDWKALCNRESSHTTITWGRRINKCKGWRTSSRRWSILTSRTSSITKRTKRKSLELSSTGSGRWSDWRMTRYKSYWQKLIGWPRSIRPIGGNCCKRLPYWRRRFIPLRKSQIWNCRISRTGWSCFTLKISRPWKIVMRKSLIPWKISLMTPNVT